MTTRCALYIP